MRRFLLAAAVIVTGLCAVPASLTGAGAQAPTDLTSTADPSEIDAGGSTTLTATLRSNAQAVEGATLWLSVKKYGTDTFIPVGDGDYLTDGSGRVSVSVSPWKRATYRWEFTGDSSYAPDTSLSSVGVHTVVTLRLRDTQISSGQRMVATGRTRPNKAGAPVYLYRRAISGPSSRWLTRTVRSDGTFRFAKTIPSTNVYYLYAVVPTASGNLRGESPEVTLFIGG